MHSVYLVAGEDDYLREDSIKAIKNKILGHFKKQQGANYKVFYASESKAEEIIDDARSLGFFNQRNLILVREFDKFSDYDKNLIVSYSKNPNKNTVLILESSDKRFLKNSALKELSIYSKLIECNPPPLSKISKYITKFTASRKKKISEKAMQLLIINLGNNLKKLDEAVEKLTLYTNRRSITSEDVEALIKLNINYNAYNLTDAIGKRKIDEALKIIRRLAVNKRASSKLLGMINWHLERIYKARELLNRGESYHNIAELFNIPKFFINKFFNQVDNFSLEDIKEGFKHILDADLALKTKKIKSKIILESLIIRLCS